MKQIILFIIITLALLQPNLKPTKKELTTTEEIAPETEDTTPTEETTEETETIEAAEAEETKEQLEEETTPKAEETPTEEDATEAEAESTEEAVPEEEVVEQKAGLETVKYSKEDIGEQGNWRKKKDWLKQAIPKNDSIQEAISKAQGFSSKFQTAFKNIDKAVDNFYNQSGFTKEKIDSLFTELNKDIDSTKEKTKKLFKQALSEIDEFTKEEASKIKEQYADAYGIEEKFKIQKNNLQELKLEIKSISDLDTSIRERLKKVEDHNTQMRKHAKQAAELNEKIWHVIDDTKARKIYHQLNSINEKVKDIQNYIQKDLYEDFNSTISKLRQQIKKTKNNIQKLEKQGLIIENRSDRLEKQIKKQKETLKLKQQIQKKLKERAKSRKAAKKDSILGKVKTFTSAAYEFIFG